MRMGGSSGDEGRQRGEEFGGGGGCRGWGRLPAFLLEVWSPAAGRKMGLVEQ